MSAVLADWRAQKNAKIETVAAELGVSRATWNHWEHGRRFPNARNLSLLAAYTGISIRRLLCAHAESCGCRLGNCPHRQ